MKPMKKYRVIRPYATYRKGDVLEANGLIGAAQYQDLIARGFIELITPQTFDLIEERNDVEIPAELQPLPDRRTRAGKHRSGVA